MSEHKGRRGAPTQLPTAGRYLDLPRHAEFNETVRTSSLIGDAQPRREGTDMSISLLPKPAPSMSGTGAPGSKDRKFPPVAASLFSLLDYGRAGGASAQSSGRVGDTLTTRERDVLRMIGHGFSNKDVARALAISPETVKSHVKNIFSKLAVRTRSEAVFRAGLLALS
jgi:DNA-binding CsgD family transcriptional regulator